ncbi:MAG: sigma-70 family RNA polymerase sigma factor [Gemmataceae bacterium]
MATGPLSVVIQHLLAELGPGGDGVTDGELLARFVSSRDEDALAALVRRHAAMVWGVCRRTLNHHDAEDAFQATFLVLARKAAGVPEHAVANWLYGVARQTAVRVRATEAKRGRRETQVVAMPEATVPEVRDGDLQVMLDEELSHLPEHYRGVIVLCDLESLTRRAAARQLGIPEGSVASRLSRARALLAKRLSQRGVTLSGSVAAVLTEKAATAVPTALVRSAIRAAALTAAGPVAASASGGTSSAVKLTDEVLRHMSLAKFKSAAGIVGVLLIAAGGLAVVLTGAGPPPNSPARVAAASPAATPAPLATAVPKELRPFQGAWTLDNVMTDAWPKPAGRGGERTWVVGGNEITWTAPSGEEVKLSFAVDPAKHPKEIDVTFLTGPHKGLRCPGVYEWVEGGGLWLCLADPGARAGRPKEVSYATNEGRSWIVLLPRVTPTGRK